MVNCLAGPAVDLFASTFVVDVDGQSVQVVHVVLQRRPRLCVTQTTQHHHHHHHHQYQYFNVA